MKGFRTYLTEMPTKNTLPKDNKLAPDDNSLFKALSRSGGMSHVHSTGEYDIHRFTKPKVMGSNDGSETYFLQHRPSGQTHMIAYGNRRGDDFLINGLKGNSRSTMKADEFYAHLLHSGQVKNLISDYSQSEGAAKTWKKVSENPALTVDHGVRMHVPYSDETKWKSLPLDRNNWDNNYDANDMAKMGSRFRARLKEEQVNESPALDQLVGRLLWKHVVKPGTKAISPYVRAAARAAGGAILSPAFKIRKAFMKRAATQAAAAAKTKANPVPPSQQQSPSGNRPAPVPGPAGAPSKKTPQQRFGNLFKQPATKTTKDNITKSGPSNDNKTKLDVKKTPTATNDNESKLDSQKRASSNDNTPRKPITAANNNNVSKLETQKKKDDGRETVTDKAREEPKGYKAKPPVPSSTENASTRPGDERKRPIDQRIRSKNAPPFRINKPVKGNQKAVDDSPRKGPNPPRNKPRPGSYKP